MQQFIHGTAASRAEVEVVNRNGDVLANGHTDANGKYGMNVEVEVGDEVRVTVKASGAVERHSEWLAIADNPAPLGEDEHEEPEFSVDNRKRLEAIYVEIVRNLADGKDVEFEHAPALLAMLNLTWDDVERDVAGLQQASCSPIEHPCGVA